MDIEQLQCTASSACRQYCDALREQGVAIEPGDENCSAPELFEITPDGVTFNPGEEVKQSTLVNNLGNALCDVLVRHQYEAGEREEVAKLEKLYHAQFGAKQALWEAMIKATRDRRLFTDAEREYYETAITHVDEAIIDIGSEMSPETVLGAQAKFDRHTMDEYGLVFDEQITGVVNRLVGNLMDGKPSLPVGDKGIAKTQAARFVARLWDGEDKEPIIISGHGDQMADEFMGKVVQDPETKTFVFKEGKLVQAMREGRPVILDEVNISDQAIVMRLQDILLRRPGQRLLLQENGNEEVEIQPGFVVMATANEASARYQHRSQLDPAFRDRFDVIELKYPDTETPVLTGIPQSLMRLALAAAVDERGDLSPHASAATLEAMARLAHVTQHLYSVPGKNAPAALRPQGTTSDFLLESDQPLMSDCITPRALVETVRRCSLGNKPGMDLATEMSRVIGALDQAGATTNQDYANKALELLTKED